MMTFDSTYTNCKEVQAPVIGTLASAGAREHQNLYEFSFSHHVKRRRFHKLIWVHVFEISLLDLAFFDVQAHLLARGTLYATNKYPW